MRNISKKKYLILLGDRNAQFFKYLKNTDNVKFYSLYKNMNLINKIGRKLFKILKIPCSLFYSEWKKEKEKFDIILLEDCTADGKIITCLRRKFPQAKIVYWFRNSIEAKDYQKGKKMRIASAKECDDIISYDRRDCVKWGFRYKENCYAIRECSEEKRGQKLNKIKYDMIFLGTDKERLNTLMKIIHYTESLKWENYIYIYSYKNEKNKYIKNVSLDYNLYISKIMQSNVILDVVNPDQEGYTLRIFEALFYNKKLISNCKMLYKEPFYHPNNIYIFDETNFDSLYGLNEFINKPFVPIDYSIKKKYDFYYWIEDL